MSLKSNRKSTSLWVDKLHLKQRDEAMKERSGLEGLRKGLTIKLWAMWLLLGAMMLPLTFPSGFGLFLAAFVPLTIDFVGRCFCVNPTPRPWLIRLSIASQLLGITCLLACYIIVPDSVVGSARFPVGVVMGAVLAVVLQVAAARFFVAHLQATAELLDRQDLILKLEVLRKHLLRTTLAYYGTGLLSIVIIVAAVFFGLMAYGIGLVLTIPLAFLFLIPMWMTCMVIYFVMLYSYQTVLQEFRLAISI